jgi:hypothetical protein
MHSSVKRVMLVNQSTAMLVHSEMHVNETSPSSVRRRCLSTLELLHKSNKVCFAVTCRKHYQNNQIWDARWMSLR